MDKLSVREIGKLFGQELDNDTYISSVVIDTSKIQKNCLFVCIKGEHFDGNTFAQQAIDAGAVSVLCNSSARANKNRIIVKDTRVALLKLASFYRSHFDIPMVALTGSVGKTTTKEMVALALSGKYKTLKTQGNLNNEIGLPQTLFAIDSSTQAAVIEMGMNHLGEISALSKATKANLGLITNIGVSHIENLGSQEGIFKAKMEILDGLSAGAPLVVNGDDKFLNRIKSTPEHQVYKFSIENGDFVAQNIVQGDSETSFDVLFYGKKQTISIPTIGIHNVYNALAAFSVACLLGVLPEVIANQLKKYTPEGMRQKTTDANGILCIEDCYNASPDSMKAAIDALVSTKSKRKIAVFADMLELGKYSQKAHYDVGKMVCDAKLDMLFAFGNEGKEYINGAKGNGFTQCFHFDDKEELSAMLFDKAQTGDAIVFKGSRGMKLEDVIKSFYAKRGKKE